ncbi:MAG: peptidase C11 [Clostridia bacterium]|nr:peptidase C11 [Clostridia bacterium]
MADRKGGRPFGRRRIDGGTGQSVHTHGSGLGTGPVGKQDAYEGRQNAGNSGNGGVQRAGGGKSFLPIIIIVVILLIAGGGTGLSGLFGGGGNQTDASHYQQNVPSQNQGGGLSSVLGGFLGNSSYSDGTWKGVNNTGKLNATSSAEKRTVLYGNGRDKVTVMVYLCGTDLESKSGMASADLREMAGADLGDNVNVVVYTGGCRQWKTKGISNSAHQIYVFENGGLRLLEKDAAGKKAMTDPTALSGFIRWCADKYPANRNILVMWDHGSGSVAGFGYDETRANAGSMPLSSIAKALKDGGVTFDFIGFDACLMATVETALTLAPYSDYLIASEETEPGIGWYHTRWLNELGRDPAIDTPTLGKIIADDFVSTCAQQCRGQMATLSVVDLAELSKNVPDELKAFAKSTAEAISSNGFEEVSKARGDTREFGAENRLDQIDLVHLSLLLDTKDSRDLANALLGAVKYNKVSSGITDAYGLAAYFPYRSANRVNSAVSQLDAMGFDDDYTACVKKFASLEVTGQAAGGGSMSPFGSLFGGSGTGPSGSVSDLIGSLLGGGGNSLLGSLLGDASAFDRDIPTETLIDTVEGARLTAPLVWTEKDGLAVLSMPESEWEKVADLQLNVFLDDGKGYIDLGLDTIFSFTDDGDLIGEYDNKWVAINRQPVAYYYTDCTVEDGETVVHGRVPVLLNGDRAELLIAFRDDGAEISGARYVYADGQTETVAKSTELYDGDEIQPICDRYSYDGEYEDSYMLGDSFVYSGEGSLTVSDVTLDPADGSPVASYMFTDRFAYEHWTEKIG